MVKSASSKLYFRELIMPTPKKNNQGKSKRLKNTIQGMRLAYPGLGLHTLLEKQALNSPEALALQFNDESINYRDLQQKVDLMANYLWQEGVRPGQIVAISLERSPDLIISLFAILKCGAAYVPIDTSYPDMRIQMMISDSEASFLICKSSKKHLSHSATNLFLDEIQDSLKNTSSKPIEVEVSSESIAYIIYTSGSTGKPKGVKVAHRNVVNLVYSMGKEPGIADFFRYNNLFRCHGHGNLLTLIAWRSNSFC